jgi:putative ABC transport system permease protein
MSVIFIQDLRYGIRTLCHNRGFFAAALLSLSLCIGANTAVLSVLDAVLWKPLPVIQPEKLVLLRHDAGPDDQRSLSYPLFADIAQRSDVFESLCASGELPSLQVRTAAGDLAGRFLGRLVTPNYFDLLGLSPAKGRFFHADNREPACVISDGFWGRVFQRHPAVLGSLITINKIDMTVVGVTPKEFSGDMLGKSPDIFLPMHLQPLLSPGFQWLEEPGNHWLTALGRLVPSLTRQTAEEALQSSFVTSQARHGRAVPPGSRHRLRVLSGIQGMNFLQESFSEPLMVLMGVVGLLLVIGCGNLANLLLARASARQKEMCVRVALGAGRVRLVRQVLTECLLLALPGALIALPLSLFGRKILVAMVSDPADPIYLATGPDWRIFGICFGFALLTTLLVGLVPALRISQVKPGNALKADSFGSSSGPERQRLGKLLLVLQMGFSMILLSGAVLFWQTVNHLKSVDSGYQSDHVLVANFSLDYNMDGFKRLMRIAGPLGEKTHGLPGIISAGISSHAGLEHSIQTNRASSSNQTGENSIETRLNYFTPGYFEACGIRLLQGRTYLDQDVGPSPRVVILDQSAARLLFHNQNPLGKFLSFETRFDPADSLEVVGVVKDTKWSNLREISHPTVYPLLSPNSGLALYWTLRTAIPPAVLIKSLRQLCREVDPMLDIDRLTTLDANINNSLRTELTLSRLNLVFGFLAFVLVATGIYGIISYSVEKRRRELGIRLALGAAPRFIRAMVLRETAELAAIGVLTGLPLAFLAARAAEKLFFGVKAWDPLSCGCTLIIVCILTVGSAWIPARRACRLDPMTALRCE